MTDQYTILIADGPWRLGALREGGVDLEDLPADGDPDAGTEPRVNAVCDRLDELGYNGQPVVLAVPSASCLCATIPTDDLESGNRRRALAYRFEEHLPLSAEDMVADYHEFDTGSALAVGADLQTLRTMVDAFDARGVAVGHICPLALLAAAELSERHTDADAVLIESKPAGGTGASASFDLIQLDAHGPAHWWWFDDDRDEAQRQLQRLADPDGATPTVIAVATEDGGASSLDLPANAEARAAEMDLHRAAVDRGGRAARDGEALWINLRCDALAMPRQLEVYRKPAIALAAALALLLLSTIGATQWRGWQYRSIADRHEHQQVELFRETLPEQRAPAVGVIESRLRSAHRELAGLGGRATADGEGLRERSALKQLQRLLAALPPEDAMRFRILDIEIEPDRLRIDGEAPNHVEAERIAVALREAGGFEVPPPRTKALPERGVSFHLLAKPGAARDDRRADARGDRS